MNACYKTCRCCGDKDVTARWSEILHAVACAACRVDGERLTTAEAVSCSDAGLVNYSRAALAAMEVIR